MLGCPQAARLFDIPVLSVHGAGFIAHGIRNTQPINASFTDGMANVPLCAQEFSGIFDERPLSAIKQLLNSQS